MKKGILLVILTISLIGLTSAATGDITEVRILPNGWVAEIDIEGFSEGGSYDFGLGGNNTLNDPKVIFNVVSEGYNESGTLTTINRTVYGTHWLRQTYPNDTIANETESGGTLTVRISLSDFIYDDDKDGGAGTSGTNATVTIAENFYYDNSSEGTDTYNSAVSDLSVISQSTLDYPKVIGRWAWPGYERVTEDFLVEAVAFHASARYGKPVAAVEFLAIDQSGNSVESTVTEVTISNRSDSDANIVLVYASTMDIDELDAEEVINITFVAYPWVGDENAALNSSIGADGYAQPNERLGPMFLLNDKDESYGLSYAYVNNSGNDSTGTVYATQAAAESGNAFFSIAGAAEAIQTYQNSNYGRNNAGGGTILLAEGNYNFTATSDLGTDVDTWLIVKPASDASKANTVIEVGQNSAFRSERTKIEGVNMTVPSGTAVIRGRTDSDVLWIHNNSINIDALFLAFKTSYATQNYVIDFDGFKGHSSNKNPFAIVRGNEGETFIDVSVDMFSLLGNKNLQASFQDITNNLNAEVSDNAVWAYNSIYDLDVGIDGGIGQETDIVHGVAVVQNVIEKVTGTQPIIAISALAQNTTNNIILWRNTLVGERQNFAYNSVGNNSVLHTQWSQKFNYFDDWNNKDDTFGTENANRTGSWAVGHNVGTIGNFVRRPGFPGEFDGLYHIKDINASFVEDASHSGDSSGNGNYSLNSNSSAIDIINQNVTDPSFYWVLPYDFEGNRIYNSADAGAYEWQPPFNINDNPLNVSTSIRVYGDEKWQVNSGSNTNTSNLSLSIPGTDTSKWVDVNITQWTNVSSENKNWTTSSDVTVSNLSHVVGGLTATNDYVVKVDGTAGANISGPACTSGVCTANSSGHILFYYTGGFSSHNFSIEEQVEVESDAGTIDQTTVVRSSGGGYPVYSISESQTDEGFSRELQKNSQVNFKVNGKSHKIVIDDIQTEVITITVSSDPITFDMKVNETKKVDLNSDKYYDLSIKLREIKGTTTKTADLFLQSIDEGIVAEEELEINKMPEEVQKYETKALNHELFFPGIGALLIVLALIVFFSTRFKKK